MCNSLLFPVAIPPLIFAPLLLLWPQLVLASCDGYCIEWRHNHHKDESDFSIDCERNAAIFNDEDKKQECKDTCDTCRDYDRENSEPHCSVYDKNRILSCPGRKVDTTIRPHREEERPNGGGFGAAGIAVAIVMSILGCVCKCCSCGCCGLFFVRRRRNQDDTQQPVNFPPANNTYGPIVSGASTTSTDTTTPIDFSGLFEKVKRSGGPAPPPPPPASSKTDPAPPPPAPVSPV